MFVYFCFKKVLVLIVFWCLLIVQTHIHIFYYCSAPVLWPIDCMFIGLHTISAGLVIQAQNNIPIRRPVQPSIFFVLKWLYFLFGGTYIPVAIQGKNPQFYNACDPGSTFHASSSLVWPLAFIGPQILLPDLQSFFSNLFTESGNKLLFF